MKKLFSLLALALLLPLAKARADDYGARIISSHSDVATGASQAGTPVILASGTIQLIGVTISSPAPNGMIVIYRSTSPTFASNIATQTRVDCNYQSVNTNPAFVPMFNMENDSYTYIQKIGACGATVWFTYPEWALSNPVGYLGNACSTCAIDALPVAPNHVGLPYNGQR